MKPVTQKYIKEITGLSKQGISKACAAGHLTMCLRAGKKMVDLDGHLTAKWLAGRKKKSKKAKPETEPIPVNPYIDDISEIEPSTNPSGLAPSGAAFDPKAKNLKDEKVRLQNEKIQLEIDQKRGDLIEKKLVVSTHNALAGIDENQLKSLNVIIGPKIDSVYTRGYSSSINKILDLLGKKEDHDLKTDILKILNSNSEPNKKEITEIIEDAIGKVLRNIKREFDLFLQRADVV